ncbi:MAG: LamG domain-containing protein, partial [Bythopirellula sp.]
ITIGHSDDAMQLGNDGAAGFELHGKMFDARIYNRAIPHWEVAELYGLVAHWKLDETSGSVAADSSGSDLHGTYIGGPTLGEASKAPALGTAVDFDEVDDRVNLPTVNFDYTRGYAFSAWMKPSAAPATFAPLISLTNGVSTDYLWFGWQPGYGLELFLSDSSGTRWIVDSIEGQVGEWDHCVVSVDPSGNATLYRNGTATATQALALPVQVSRSQNNIGFGNSASVDYFPGLIDDVRFYQRPISLEEVQQLYSGGDSPGMRIIRWVEAR